jgi:hypothetical protein
MLYNIPSATQNIHTFFLSCFQSLVQEDVFVTSLYVHEVDLTLAKGALEQRERTRETGMSEFEAPFESARITIPAEYACVNMK